MAHAYSTSSLDILFFCTNHLLCQFLFYIQIHLMRPYSLLSDGACMHVHAHVCTHTIHISLYFGFIETHFNYQKDISSFASCSTLKKKNSFIVCFIFFFYPLIISKASVLSLLAIAPDPQSWKPLLVIIWPESARMPLLPFCSFRILVPWFLNPLAKKVEIEISCTFSKVNKLDHILQIKLTRKLVYRWKYSWCCEWCTNHMVSLISTGLPILIGCMW